MGFSVTEIYLGHLALQFMPFRAAIGRGKIYPFYEEIKLTKHNIRKKKILTNIQFFFLEIFFNSQGLYKDPEYFIS